MRLASMQARARRAAEEREEPPPGPAPPSTHHSDHQFKNMKNKFFNELTHMPMPMWAIGAIVVVVLALVACLGFCIWKKCISKGKKPKKVRERKGGRGRRKKEGAGEGEEGKVRGD
uniref:Synaptotagmin n=1 Tax=Hucho hucho TaxID=62062 RepID=A0A4W5L6E1_9TELE